jgi:hypothetical protein
MMGAVRIGPPLFLRHARAAFIAPCARAFYCAMRAVKARAIRPPAFRALREQLWWPTLVGFRGAIERIPEFGLYQDGFDLGPMIPYEGHLF